MSEPRAAFHFFFELAGAPAGIARKNFHLLRAGKRFADVHERIEGVSQVQIRDDIGVGNKSVAVQKTQSSGLDGATEEKRLFFERVGQIGDDHFANFISAAAIEDEPERAFGIVFANEDNRVMEKRAVELPAVEQQLSFEIFWDLSHARANLQQACRDDKSE